MNITRLHQLDLNLLLALHVLATEKSVTRAARRLGLGQPAMSATLARLRSVFEDEILVRSGRTMRLTPRGAELAERVREALDLLDRTVEMSGGFQPEKATRTFRITLTPDDGILLLSPLLRRLRSEAPGIEIKATCFTHDTPRSLERGETDLWVLPQYRTDPAYPSEILFHDRWCLVGCARHHRKTVLRRGSDFSQLEWVDVVQEPGSFPRTSSMELTRFRDQIRVAAQVPSRLEAAFAVMGTPYVFGCPERIAKRLARETRVRVLPISLRLIPRDSRPPAYGLAMQWHPINDGDPSHRWLRETIRQVAATC